MTKDTTYKVLLTTRVKMLVAKFSVDEEKNTTTTIKQCLINYLILILINLF